MPVREAVTNGICGTGPTMTAPNISKLERMVQLQLFINMAFQIGVTAVSVFFERGLRYYILIAG
jgi:hypothetical protein